MACQPGSYANVDPQSGMGASELCGGGVWAMSGRSRAAPGLQYVMIIQSNINDLQMKRERRRKGGLHTNFVKHKKRDALPSASRMHTSSSSTNRVLWHPAGSHKSSTRRITSVSLTALCNIRM